MKHATLLSVLFLFPILLHLDTAQAQTASAAKNRLEVETKALQNEAPANEGILEDATVRTRLPNYYRNVVTEEQREQIYEIQRQYNPLLNYLRKRVELLQAELDEKTNAVLDTDQRAKIEKAAEDARRTRRTSTSTTTRTTRPAARTTTPAPETPKPDAE